MMRRLALVAALLATPCAALHAQGTWDAILTIDPYPSPYYSDWDANPNISTLTIINSTTSSVQVRIHFNVTDQSNRVVVSGTSEPEIIGAGATVIFDSPYDVAGSTTHDTEMEEIASRTGRLPEGEYTACAVGTDASGFVLAESCAMFTIVYPDPPLLLEPLDEEIIHQQDPLFQWTPVHVPIDYQLSYVMNVAEVLEGQTPAEALRSDPVRQTFEGEFGSLRYPIDALPLEAGKRYAWSVQALDQNGYAASANDGQSEIWTFVYDDGTTPLPGDGASIMMLSNSAGAPPAAGPSSLDLICTAGTLPRQTALEMAVDPAFLPASYNGPVTLYNDTVSGDWAVIVNPAANIPSFLLYGNCNDGGPLGGLRWIARRKDAGDLGIPIDTLSAPSLEWRFRVLIVPLVATTAGKDMPDSFDLAHRFMEGHEISVNPAGVNVYGVLEGGWLHDFLGWFGHEDPHLALQGYIGLSHSINVGGHIGGSFEAVPPEYDASGGVVVTVLSLTASLPERPLDVGPLQSSQVSVQLVGKAKGNVTWASSGKTHTWAGAGIELEAGLNVAALFTDGIERTLTVGFVHEAVDVDSKEAEPGDTASKSFLDRTKAVIKLASDRSWTPIQRWNALTINNPEFELEIELADLRQRTSGSWLNGVTGKISGDIGLGEYDDVGKVEVEVGRKADPERPTTRPRSRTIDEGSDPGPRTRPRSDTDADQTERPLTEEPTGKVFWKAGVKLGNMSLGEFVRLITTGPKGNP